MIKTNETLKKLYKICGSNVHNISLHSNVRLIIDCQSYNATAKALRLTNLLGFKVTHKATSIFLDTKAGKLTKKRGYRFMARIDNPDNFITNAQIILENTNNLEEIIEILTLNQKL